MYETKKLFIFDVDGTLAESWQPIEEPVAEFLCALLAEGKHIAFATARDFVTMRETVIERMPCFAPYADQVYLLVASGAAFLVFQDGDWHEIYAERIRDESITACESAYQQAFEEVMGADTEHFSFHTREKDGLMISLFALDESQPESKKSDWDTDRSRRYRMVELLAPQFPDLDLRIGGRTTIDITKRSVNKAYGIQRLLEHTGMGMHEAIFTGDGFFTGGNDTDVLELGIDVVPTDGPADTLAKLSGAVRNSGQK